MQCFDDHYYVNIIHSGVHQILWLLFLSCMLFPLDLIIALFLSIFCSFLWIKHQFIPKHSKEGKNILVIFKYIIYIVYLFSGICPFWRSLSSCSTQDCFLGLVQSWHPGNLLLPLSWRFLLSFYVLYSHFLWSHTFFSVFFLIFSGMYPLRAFWAQVYENKFGVH